MPRLAYFRTSNSKHVVHLVRDAIACVRFVLRIGNLPWSLAEGRLPTVAPPPGRARLLSVASMSWPPHAEGVAWFLDDVWPRVRASRPDATLDLVGSPPDASRAAAWSAVPGVRFVGRVDDVAACYAECDLAIVPAHRGGGSSIKTPEAYLHGRACVVTSAGACAGSVDETSPSSAVESSNRHSTGASAQAGGAGN